MSRSVLIPLLLVTHGAALWLGSKQAAPVEPIALPAEGSFPAAATEPGWREFLERAKTEQAAAENAVPGKNWDELIDDARAALPPDADLAAMVNAGCSADIEEMPSPQAMAAFGQWMDLDPLAALSWHVKQYPDGNSYFTFEVARHLKNGGLARLDEYLSSCPAARELLIGVAATTAAEDGCKAVTEVASKLASQVDRLAMVKRGLCPDTGDFAAQLPAVRAMLDEDAIVRFMTGMGQWKIDVSGAFRQAGFPEECVLRYQKEWADAREREAKLDAREAKEAVKFLVEKARDTSDAMSKPMDYDLFFIGQVPEQEAWTKDFKDQRITAGELYSRMVNAIPGGPEMDRDLSSYFLRQNFEADPMACTEWLRSHRQDWQEILSHELGMHEDALVATSLHYSPEELFTLACSLPREVGQDDPMALSLTSAFQQWRHLNADDPERYLREQPASPVRDRLLERLEKEEGR